MRPPDMPQPRLGATFVPPATLKPFRGAFAADTYNGLKEGTLHPCSAGASRHAEAAGSRR
jgi:hypothetical protein